MKITALAHLAPRWDAEPGDVIDVADHEAAALCDLGFAAINEQPPAPTNDPEPGDDE